jgi:hypothetical protein
MRRDGRASANEIGAVAGSVIDSHFAYAFINRRDIAGIAERESVDP